MNGKQAKMLRKLVGQHVPPTKKKQYNLTNMGGVKFIPTNRIGVDGKVVMFQFQPQLLSHKTDTFTFLYKSAKRTYKRAKGEMVVVR